MKKKILLTVILLLAGFLAGFLARQISLKIQLNRAQIHYSAFSKKDFFERAFKAAQSKEISAAKNARGIIVNHHLLAADLIAQAFLAVSGRKPRTVVLISPNHFAHGRGKIITSAYDWQTPYGILRADKKNIEKLRANGALAVDESPFEKEHGVFNITAFIKKVFPRAKIIPVIMKENISANEMENFARELERVLPKKSLVILSADFSHETTQKIAEENDKKSLDVIEKLDLARISEVTIDSRPALGVFLRYMRLAGANNWQLFANSNAAEILGKEPDEGVTSYITGAFFAIE